MSAKAETKAELVSPIPGMRPINGSSPNRNWVPGTRMISPMISAIHLKSGSKALALSLFFRRENLPVENFRLSIFDCTVNRSKSKIADRDSKMN